MEVFKPFLGYSYFNKFEKSNNVSRFVCPYNFEVFSKEKYGTFLKNEHNIFNFKEAEKGKEKLKSWVDGSVLVSTKTPAFYIYEMSYKVFGNIYSFIGIIGALKIPEEGENFVVTCEETLEKEVDFQLNFLKNCGFSSSPICALYEGETDEKFSNLIKNKMSSSYIFKAKQSNVIHKIWKIDDEDLVKILLDFFKDKVYYIFSGTEKFQAAVQYKENFDAGSNYVMMLAFSRKDFSFSTLPIHRLVSGINMFDSEEILKKASKFFDLVDCKTLNSMRRTLFNFRREGKNSFGIYADGNFHVLSLKDEEYDRFVDEKGCFFKKFDVFILNNLFFKETLNIDDENIDFCCVDEHAVMAVDSGDACFAVFLSAVRSSEFFEVLKSRKKMPEKSFYFFPKPVEGLLIYSV